jgi:hypothetical protein
VDEWKLDSNNESPLDLVLHAFFLGSWLLVLAGMLVMNMTFAANTSTDKTPVPPFGHAGAVVFEEQKGVLVGCERVFAFPTDPRYRP